MRVEWCLWQTMMRNESERWRLALCFVPLGQNLCHTFKFITLVLTGA